MKRRRRTIIIIATTFAIIIMALCICYKLFIDYVSVFDRYKWDNYTSHRVNMIKNLEDKYDFTNMTASDIKMILGKRNLAERENWPRELYYYIGHPVMDAPLYYYIQFDDAGVFVHRSVWGDISLSIPTKIDDGDLIYYE